MTRSGFVWALPVLTFVLGLAIGRSWPPADPGGGGAADGARKVGPGAEAVAPVARPAASRPGPAAPPAPAATTAAVAERATLERQLNEARDEIARLKQGAGRPTTPSQAPPAAPPAREAPAVAPPADADAAAENPGEAGAAQMLKVLLTNPEFRNMFLDQLVSQVEPAVKFTPEQRQTARQELNEAIKPLLATLAKGDLPIKDLDPALHAMKEDWEHRVDPLLTAEQRIAFQKWLGEKHTLSIGVGVDQKGKVTKRDAAAPDPGPDPDPADGGK